LRLLPQLEWLRATVSKWVIRQATRTLRIGPSLAEKVRPVHHFRTVSKQIRLRRGDFRPAGLASVPRRGVARFAARWRCWVSQQRHLPKLMNG